jgi:hypothetical protein
MVETTVGVEHPPASLPVWETLSLDTRSQVVQLLAEMAFHQVVAQRRAGVPGKEVRVDDDPHLAQGQA